MRLAWLWLVVLSAPASADPITVRAGEHGSFTRVVLDIPPGTAWRTEAVEGGILVRTDGNGDGFDTSGSFAKLNASRIAVLEGGQSDLLIRFGCDCEAESFQAGPGMVAVDVRAARNPIEKAQRNRESPLSLPVLFDLPAVPDAANSKKPSHAEQAKISVVEQPGFGLEALAEAFAKAGLRHTADVEFSEPGLANGPDTVPENPQKDPTQQSFIPEPGIQVGGNGSADAIAASGSVRSQPCIDDRIGLPVAKVEDTPLYMPQRSLRLRITDSRGDLDEEKLAELAQFYISWGLGAEALAVLALLSEPDAAAVAVAAILADEETRLAQSRAGFVRCDAPAGLWNALLFSGDPLSEEEARKATMQFSELPVHLQAVLRKPLMATLDKAGHSNLKPMVERALRTRPEAPGADRRETDGSVPSASEAERELEAPFALMEFIAQSKEQRGPLTDDTLRAVEYYAFLHRNAALASELRLALAEGLGRDGRVKEALVILRDMPGSEAAELTVSKLLKEVPRLEDDYAFLELVTDPSLVDPGAMDADGRLETATRLIAARFPAAADRFLVSMPREKQGVARQLSFAIAIARSDFQAAERLAARMEGPESVFISAVLAYRREDTNAQLSMESLSPDARDRLNQLFPVEMELLTAPKSSGSPDALSRPEYTATRAGLERLVADSAALRERLMETLAQGRSGSPSN